MEEPNSLQVLKLILEDLEKNHNINPEQAFKLIKNDDQQTVPVSIFVQELTILEAITKHLHEQKGLRFTEIANILKRSPRSIWGSFKLASKKHPESLPINSSSIRIQTKLFSHPILSPSQILVINLVDEHKMRLADVAKLIHRDNRTIWTMYNVGKKKMHKGEKQ